MFLRSLLNYSIFPFNLSLSNTHTHTHSERTWWLYQQEFYDPNRAHNNLIFCLTLCSFPFYVSLLSFLRLFSFLSKSLFFPLLPLCITFYFYNFFNPFSYFSAFYFYLMSITLFCVSSLSFIVCLSFYTKYFSFSISKPISIFITLVL